MGVDYSTYVGPYIQVHNPEVPSSFEFYACVNPKCEDRFKEQSSKFCPKCGNEIKLHKKACTARKSEDFDIYSELKGQLYEALSEYQPDSVKNYLFLLSNVKGTPGKNFDPKTECYVYEMGEINAKTEIEIFQKCFVKEIEKLKQFFNPESVQVKWGVLGWVS